MIEIVGLKKSFEDLCVLENINLTIDDGDIYGLVGKSGAGKSTLLNCINGLETYDSGTLKVNGVEIKGLNKKAMCEFRKDVAMIFQNFALMSRKTVYENIAFPMRCWKYDKSHINKRVLQLAEVVGITDKLQQKPRTLSGGQKQRVAIARALAMEPKILLSDEATSALDPETTQAILQLLREINEQLGITIIMVTHQMPVVRKICKNVSLLQNGHLVTSGPVEKLFLERTEEFWKFAGNDEILPPKEGFNLEIMMSGDEKSILIFSAISRDLQIDFSVAGGKIENYQGKSLGSLIVNFMDKDARCIREYLTAQGIIWYECEQFQANNGQRL